jgi:hypothetical protein
MTPLSRRQFFATAAAMPIVANAVATERAWQGWVYTYRDSANRFQPYSHHLEPCDHRVTTWTNNGKYPGIIKDKHGRWHTLQPGETKVLG